MNQRENFIFKISRMKKLPDNSQGNSEDQVLYFAYCAGLLVNSPFYIDRSDM